MSRFVKSLVVFALFLTWASPVRANGHKAYIYYTPESGKDGQSTKAGLIAEGIEGLRGFEVRMNFDPSVVQISDADQSMAGTQVEMGTMFKDALVAVNRVDNSKGEILISAAKPGAEVTGTTDLIWFDLKSVGPGDPKLNIADGGVQIVDKTMKETRVTVETGAKLETDRIGQSLTMMGGILLTALVAYQLYSNKKHRRRKRIL